MTLKSSMLIKTFSILVLATIVTACASTGPTTNPIKRKLSWLPYLEGSDIRDACANGAPPQYRIVYNGVYTEQVRAYDLSADGTLEYQVFGPANLRNMQVSSANDLLNPWRGTHGVINLPQDDVRRIVSSLDNDGAFGPPNVGLELSSKGFFWTVAACHQGQYSFTAWAWPSDAWDDLTFDDAVLAVDASGIALNKPRKTDTTRLSSRGLNNKTSEHIENAFWTKVGERGLVGVPDLKW